MDIYNTLGIDDVCIGLMNVLSIFNQSFGPFVLFRYLSGNSSN